MIIELITANAEADQSQRPYYPSPSKATACERALCYHGIGVKPKRFSGRAMMLFEDGHLHEDAIKDYIKGTVMELTELKGKNQRFKIATIDGVDMDGEIDGLITDPLGTTRVLEIKGINHFTFQRLDKEPYNHAIHQSNLYMHGFRDAGFKDIHETLLIIKNKNTSALYEMVIKYDEEMALADIAKFERVAQYIKKNQVPPRPYDRDKAWQCSYCSFSEECYKNYDEEFKAMTADAALDNDMETEFKYYLQLGTEARESKKAYEDLRDKIKARLKDAGVRAGKTTDYTAKITLSSRESIDKTLIPPDLMPKFIKTSTSEKLTIRKIKEEGEK